VETVVIAVLALMLGGNIACVVACWWNRLRRAESRRREAMQDQRVLFLEAMLWRGQQPGPVHPAVTMTRRR